MRRVSRRSILLVLLPLVVCGATGCGLPNLLIYPFAPREAVRSVARQHALTAERLLILPYAGHDVLFEYPSVGREISFEVIRQITKNLRGRVSKVINPAQVELYQQSKLDWPTTPVAEVGREFKADKVLYIELSRFSIMEERSANLYRGRVAARIQVVDTGAAAGDEVLYEAEVSVELPDERPIGAMEMSEAKLRWATVYRFAEEVIWKFYDHEEKVIRR